MHVLLCFMCGWMAGWLWGSRSTMLLQTVSQWGRERGERWNDTHNFRLKHVCVYNTTFWIIFTQMHRNNSYSCWLWSKTETQVVWFLGSRCCGNQLSRFPSSDSRCLSWSPARSNKWVLCQPQAVWHLFFSICSSLFSLLSRYSQSTGEKHAQSICQTVYPHPISALSFNLYTPCLPLPHLSIFVHKKPPGTPSFGRAVGERMEKGDFCQICQWNDRSSGKDYLLCILSFSHSLKQSH